MEANQLTAEELAAIREEFKAATRDKTLPEWGSCDERSWYEFAEKGLSLIANVEALRAENERLAKTLKESLMLLNRYTKSSSHDTQTIREWMERTGAASLARMSILREEPEV